MEAHKDIIIIWIANNPLVRPPHTAGVQSYDEEYVSNNKTKWFTTLYGARMYARQLAKKTRAKVEERASRS